MVESSPRGLPSESREGYQPIPKELPDSFVVRFFASQSAFREWLEDHHNQVLELWVGFYKKQSGKGGITYREALDEALCFGWIDGLRKTVDDSSYSIRFTPRTAAGIWSEVNTRRVEELTKLGRMQGPGLSAFRTRDSKKSRLYLREEQLQI